jgi:hypothetical protein
MAETRSINRSMMQSPTTSFDFSLGVWGVSSPCNVQYTGVNVTNSSLKCRGKQASGILNHNFAYIFFFDSSTTAAQHGASPYKMSEFYDLALDTAGYPNNYHVPASGELSIGDESE